MEVDYIKLLGQGGIMLVLVVVMGKIMWMIGLRMIAAIDALRAKILDHTEETNATLGALRTDLTVLIARVETALDMGSRTPVAGVPIPTNTQSERQRTAAATEYSHRKDKTR